MSDQEEPSPGVVWVDPPGDQSLIDVRDPGLGTGSQVKPAPAPTDEVEWPSFVVYLVEDSSELRRAAFAICEEMTGFQWLPMLIANATEEQAARLADLAGVIVAPGGPSLPALVPIVRGLDEMASVVYALEARRLAPYVVGGTLAGDGRYPTLVERGTRLDFVADGSLHFDTRPARMPIINLSVGPPDSSGANPSSIRSMSPRSSCQGACCASSPSATKIPSAPAASRPRRGLRRRGSCPSAQRRTRKG